MLVASLLPPALFASHIGSMRDLVLSYLAPNWIDARDEDKVKALMDSSKVSKMMSDARPYLKDLFQSYIQNDARVMTLKCFENMMRDAGVLTRNPGERAGDAEERMSGLAENCFFAAQGFPPRQLELPELVFAEFLEATCRLCGETLNKGGGGGFEKFQLGVDALMDLKRTGHK